MAGQGWAQTDKPRFVILLDNSTSMTENLAGVQTHGDGSQSQPGCNIDGTSTAGWAYDDSKFLFGQDRRHRHHLRVRGGRVRFGHVQQDIAWPGL
jgi:hypothetical protein